MSKFKSKQLIWVSNWITGLKISVVIFGLATLLIYAPYYVGIISNKYIWHPSPGFYEDKDVVLGQWSIGFGTLFALPLAVFLPWFIGAIKSDR